MKRTILNKIYAIEDNYSYDSCSSDNTSKYTVGYHYWGEKSGSWSLTYENNSYKLVNNVGAFLGVLVNNIIFDNYELSVEAKGSSCGVGIIQDQEKGYGLHQPNSTTSKHLMLYNPATGIGNIDSEQAVSGYHVDDWHTYRLTKTGSTVKFEILYNGTVIFTRTKTNIASNLANNTHPAITARSNDYGYYRNIKIKLL